MKEQEMYEIKVLNFIEMLGGESLNRAGNCRDYYQVFESTISPHAKERINTRWFSIATPVLHFHTAK